eukprot:7457396-Heterocapsa_arctica.AAC.1
MPSERGPADGDCTRTGPKLARIPVGYSRGPCSALLSSLGVWSGPTGAHAQAYTHKMATGAKAIHT